jgi:hypothetical protein
MNANIGGATHALICISGRTRDENADAPAFAFFPLRPSRQSYSSAPGRPGGIRTIHSGLGNRLNRHKLAA